MDRLTVLFTVFALIFFPIISIPVQTLAQKTLRPQVKAMPRMAVNIRDIKLQSRITLQSTEKQQVNQATKSLVNQQFSSKLRQSLDVRPSVTIINRVGNKIQASALVVFRSKSTYTATISFLKYNIEGNKTTLIRKIENYAPSVRIASIKRPISTSTIQLKKQIMLDPKVILRPGPKALVNTPCPEFPSAVSATNSIYNTFVNAFGSLSVQKKIGSESTKPYIMSILKNDPQLVAWNNIGHGNPYSIIQWGSDPIWYSEFPTTTEFKGITAAVILLNSCQVCGSPYNLRNAILNHNPRTYIGGIPNLPVARSEFVDVDFWNYSLLQNKTMGWALNQASVNHGLVGSFCLNGDNGTF